MVDAEHQQQVDNLAGTAIFISGDSPFLRMTDTAEVEIPIEVTSRPIDRIDSSTINLMIGLVLARVDMSSQ